MKIQILQIPSEKHIGNINMADYGSVFFDSILVGWSRQSGAD